MDSLRQQWLTDPWFVTHFSIVDRSRDLLLWQRNQIKGCQQTFPLKIQLPQIQPYHP